MTRRYRVSRLPTAYLIGFSVISFGLFIAFVLVPDVAHDWKPAHVVQTLVVILLALGPAIALALQTYEATLADHGELEFKSVLRRRRLRVAQIRALVFDEDQIYLEHDRGRVRLPADANFKDLLQRGFELNPAIKADDDARRLLGAPA